MDIDKTVDTAEETVETQNDNVAEEAADASSRTQRSNTPRPQGGNNNIRRKKKVCAFCVEKIDHIDYKDVNRLRKYVSERAKILPRRVTGTCAKHQRDITVAIKRARLVALMPYISD